MSVSTSNAMSAVVMNTNARLLRALGGRGSSLATSLGIAVIALGCSSTDSPALTSLASSGQGGSQASGQASQSGSAGQGGHGDAQGAQSASGVGGSVGAGGKPETGISVSVNP